MTRVGPAPVSPRGGRSVKPKGPKKTEYYLSIEKFNWACQLFEVPQANQLEAVEWVSTFAQAATDAPKQAMRELRNKRWEN